METAEIVQQFERATGRFARAAVQAAVARRDEVTPALLLILQETTDRAVRPVMQRFSPRPKRRAYFRAQALGRRRVLAGDVREMYHHNRHFFQSLTGSCR
jgi:Protein of unknown function (DUF1186)